MATPMLATPPDQVENAPMQTAATPQHAGIGPPCAARVDADRIVAAATALARALFEAAHVDESHGIAHALAVLAHAESALSAAEPPTPTARALAVRLAALLHDADDRKYFPSSGPDHPNAARILADARAPSAVAADALRMIGLVSTSANGNAAPDDARASPELLWPRWSDRLEATGEIGIVRCWQYNAKVGAPLAVDGTPRPASAEEVWALATPDRFDAYQASGGASASMLDHYYDKLLQISRPPAHLVRNAYLEAAAEERAAPLVEVCLEYGRTGAVPLERIRLLADELAI